MKLWQKAAIVGAVTFVALFGLLMLVAYHIAIDYQQVGVDEGTLKTTNASYVLHDFD